MAKQVRRKTQRVSEIYKLGRTQGSLDFVDVNVSRDTPLFISPTALAHLPSDWGDGCVYLVQNFFQTVLQAIKEGKHDRAESLLNTLKEPNETHLGVSTGASRGRALGDGSAHKVWGAMAQSEAAKSGLLRDLEDTVLLIPGVGVDIISDMTTNIIRGPLIEYTQIMCERFGITLKDGVDSGPLWDPANRRWFTRYERLPMTKFGKLLLVPKAIVRPDIQFKADQYYRHHILTFLQKMELNAGSALVYLLADGTRKVNKTAVIQKYGSGKTMIVEQTLKHPEMLDAYRAEMAKQPYNPLSHEMIAMIEKDSAPDWDQLLDAVLSVKPGKESATDYENAVEALLTALFYPDLTNPNIQHEIHDGRKRIDIKYTNMGIAGFFSWVAKHYPAPLIWIECKNYSKDVANPELDQLSGRFSPSRGKVGLLVCRSFDNKDRFFDRCKDTAKDDRGFIIPLDDDDLATLVAQRKDAEFFQQWTLLSERFERLVS
jgi:hypothetical protein